MCPYENRTIFHWAGGGGGPDSCYCELGYTGDNCEVVKCPTQLYPLSMGSMLFFADRRLREYSDSHDSSDNRTIEEAKTYLRNLLYSYVDINGDGSINKTEMLTSLRSKGVGFNLTAANETNFNSKLWCKTASLGLENCYQESGYNTSDSAAVSVDDIFNDAWYNFDYTFRNRFGK